MENAYGGRVGGTVLGENRAEDVGGGRRWPRSV